MKAVDREWYRVLRRVPNDPALHVAESAAEWPGTAPGTRLQWALERQEFYGAWDVTTGGGRVAVLDTGIAGSHPEFAGKVASADAVGTSSPLSDPDGHGSHTSGLACAATDNGFGIAGAGSATASASSSSASTSWHSRRHHRRSDSRRRRPRREHDQHELRRRRPQRRAGRGDHVRDREGALLLAAASNSSNSDQGAPSSQLQPNNGRT